MEARMTDEEFAELTDRDKEMVKLGAREAASVMLEAMRVGLAGLEFQVDADKLIMACWLSYDELTPEQQELTVAATKEALGLL